jgi:CheY-like chemotaxis protein
MVIEDETALRIIYERVLTKTDYEVLLARDGQQAIELLRGITPDLIFLDMLLPNISGLVVLEFIAQQPAIANHAHIVIASSSKEYEQYTSLAPSCEFILKPILPTQIRDIALALQEARQGR